MRPSLFAAALLLTACEGDVVDTTDTDTEADTEGDTEAFGTQLTGRITDASGQGMAGVRVNLCRDICTTDTTAADGSYEMPQLLSNRYSLHVETHGDLATVDASAPFELDDSGSASLDIVLPGGTPVALPAVTAELEVAPDLLITAGAGDVTLLFEEDPTHLSGARVATEDAIPVDLAGSIAAIWYIEPWSAEAESGLSVRIRDTFGGVVGATYQLWQSDYDSSEWVSLGMLTSDGTYLDGDVAISRFDTLVLVSASTP